MPSFSQSFMCFSKGTALKLVLRMISYVYQIFHIVRPREVPVHLNGHSSPFYDTRIADQDCSFIQLQKTFDIEHSTIQLISSMDVTKLVVAWSGTNVWHLEQSVHVVKVSDDQNSCYIVLEKIVWPKKLSIGCYKQTKKTYSAPTQCLVENVPTGSKCCQHYIGSNVAKVLCWLNVSIK